MQSTRIGGYGALRHFLGLRATDDGGTIYHPVIAVFAAAIALAASFAAVGNALTLRAIEWFVSITMLLLAMLELQNVVRFSTMFLDYDLLARRRVPYSYIYPFADFVAGALMNAQALDLIPIQLAAAIGAIGAVSVFYAVYFQKRELTCACVGGSNSVQLGFVSLTENLFMVGMALWMLTKQR